MSTYRYPGVKPFETSDRHIFFGRDKDIADLHDLILLEKLVVLFGKSGYGKSSLLNAGIVPKFREADPTQGASYLPITVRFGLYVDEKSISPLEQVRRRLAEEAAVNPESAFLLEGDSLWYHFKRHSPLSPPAGGESGRGFMLVFDQFEEFFSYPPAEQVQFKEELAELLYKNLPQPVREKLDTLPEAQQHFLLRKLDVKAVFAIRSDRMSDLDSLKDRLSAILYKRYELKGLGEKQAKQAIIAPAALPMSEENPFISLPFAYTEEALNKIIRELSADDQHAASSNVRSGIEAFQLQILCQYIENEVIHGRIRDRNNDGTPDVHADDLPDIAKVYEAYYRSQLDRLDPSEREAARELIEYGLLYEDPQKGEARRLSVDADLLVQQFAAQGATRTLLTRLENTFLLRREMNTLGGYNYELSHDTLIAPVLKAKAEREAEKERLAAERRAQEAENKAREERRRSQRARIFALVGFLLAAVAIGFGIWAFSLNRKATVQRIEIEENLKALTQKEEALQLTLQEAKQARDTADVRRIEAELATTEAERQTEIADLAKLEAQANLAQATQANERVAASLLKDVDKHILNMEYDQALEKINAAAGLTAEKKSIFPVYLEVAFWYNETGQTRRALSILNTATTLVGKVKPLKSENPTRMQLREAIETLDSNYYAFLMRRYYPHLLPIKGGTFEMGCDSSKLKKAYGEHSNCGEDETLHTVTLSDYSIAETETTWWQFGLYRAATGKNVWENRPDWQPTGDHPIVNVSWYDAIEYANWVTQQFAALAKDTVYSGDLRSDEVAVDWTKKGYRLPTEAEWEYAAGAGGKDLFAGTSSPDELYLYANYNGLKDGYNQTAPVKTYRPNAFGLYDMSGNVWERCWDWMKDYPSESKPNPVGPATGNTRMLRGGSWGNDYDYCRVSDRLIFYPDEWDFDKGFRLSRVL